MLEKFRLHPRRQLILQPMNPVLRVLAPMDTARLNQRLQVNPQTISHRQQRWPIGWSWIQDTGDMILVQQGTAAVTKRMST